MQPPRVHVQPTEPQAVEAWPPDVHTAGFGGPGGMKLYMPIEDSAHGLDHLCAVTAAALTTMFQIGLGECGEKIAREITEHGKAWDD